MADNYLEFSEVISNLSEEEEAWLTSQLGWIEIRDGQEIDIASVNVAGKDAEWVGPRFLRDDTDYDSDSELGPGFAFEFCDDSRDGWGRHLWLHNEEWGNPDNLAHLVQKFLREFRPNEYWCMSYAMTCSKPRVGEFGGGAVFVTADKIKTSGHLGFLDGEARKFEERRKQ